MKAADSLPPIHEAIVLDYLRLSGHRLGLLINFNVNVLKDSVRRYIIYDTAWSCPELTESATESTLGERCQKKEFVY